MSTRKFAGFMAATLIGLVGFTTAGPIGTAGASRVSSSRAASSTRDPAIVLVPVRVVLRLSATDVLTSERLHATVTIEPRVASRIVTLQRRGAKRWRNVATATTNARGRATFPLIFRDPGAFSFRVVLAPSVTSGPEKSRIGTVTVAPPPPAYAGLGLAEGSSGAAVLALQQRLSGLGYWLGTPNGSFGDATEQAVYAIQKAAGVNPSGVVNAATVAALVAGVLPTPRTTLGYVIEVNLKDDLVMFVNNGHVENILNTSTGGGYTYVDQGVSYVATTPRGIYHIYRTVNGLVVDTLGALWRPRFFTGGFAIHGDTYVPAYAASHGCVRVSYEAINWIWANNLAPIGTEVWVYDVATPSSVLTK